MTILRTDIVSGIGGRNAIDGSVFFSETNDRLSVPNSADVRVGSDDFTIEAWIRVENPGDWTTVIGMWDSSAGRRTYALQRKKADSKLYFYVSADGGSTIGATNTQFASGGDVKLGEWHHVAGVRDGNTIRAYLNGVEVGNASFTASILNNTTDALFIGDTEVTAGGEAFNGYMSNVRLIKGTCLYPSGTTFTPPIHKLAAISNTVLLCCQDSDDPTQEATGKTITAYGNLDYSLITDNLITNGNFDSSASDGWTVASGSAALGTGQSGTFGDGNHLVLTSGTMTQAFTTVIGKTYFVNAQSNGADNSFISTTTSSGDAIITDIRSSPQTGNGVRGQKSFVATQTTYYVILTGGGGGGNFDTISVYEAESPKAPKALPPVGKDDGTVFEGDITFDSLNYMTLPKGITTQANRGRGMIMGGFHPFVVGMEYVSLISSGNAIPFGDLTVNSLTWGGAGASSTRAVIGGGAIPAVIANIEYVTIATTGKAQTFGNLHTARRSAGVVSNETRALFGGGETASASTMTDLVDKIEIATTGNAVDWVDLFESRRGTACASSSTRGIWTGGQTPSSYVSTIDYVTIATQSDAQDFGDLLDTRAYHGGASNNIRGVFAAGNAPSPGAVNNVIQYVTIATTGHKEDFGDLFLITYSGGALASQTRGLFVGGADHPGGTYQNILQYVNISTTGNAMDFGDMVAARGQYDGSTSDCHGGLG